MSPTGHYPIEHRRGEIDRLEMQSDSVAADAEIMLDRIGVMHGWRCLDLGCGPGFMLEAMSRRAGPTGRVVGLDPDEGFIDFARTRARERGLANVEGVVGDAYRAALPEHSFDLVHARAVASTAGEPERLIREAMRLARPGGFVAFQEPDFHSLRCFPGNEAWGRLAKLLEAAFTAVGSDVRLGDRLFQLVRNAGLREVQYRPFLVGFRASDPMADYVPATVESVRRTLIEHRLVDDGELDRLLAAARKHLADPGTVSTFLTLVQVWGTTPPA